MVQLRLYPLHIKTKTVYDTHFWIINKYESIILVWTQKQTSLYHICFLVCGWTGWDRNEKSNLINIPQHVIEIH